MNKIQPEDVKLEQMNDSLTESNNIPPKAGGPPEIKINALVRFIHAHPCAMIWIVIVSALAMSVIAFTVVSFVMSPNGNFYTRNGEIAEKFDAFRSLSSFKAVEAAGKSTETPQSRQLGGLNIIWVAKTSDNVFSAPLLEKIRSIEIEMQNDVDWEKTCLFAPNTTTCSKPFSPSYSLGLFNDSTGSLENLSTKLSQLASPASMATPASFFFSKQFSTSNPKSQITRSIFSFGGPLEGFKNAVDRKLIKEQEAKLAGIVDRWHQILKNYRNDTGGASDPDLQAVYVGTHITDKEIDEIVAADITLFVVAIAAVFIILMIHTGSGFLATTAIIHIILAFPTAYFLYRFVLQYEIFTSQNLLALFIILGVGADDVFVFKDAWMQSFQGGPGPNKDTLHRLAWTWNRSVSAMTTTSFTTAAAFFATAISPIPSIRVLGVFTALAVLANFAFVITYFPAIVLIWHRWGWDSHCCGKSMESPEEKQQRIQHMDLHEIDPSRTRTIPGMFGSKEQIHTEYAHIDESRPVERWFHTEFTPFLFQYRFVAMILCLCLVGMFAGFASTLEVSEENDSAFEPEFSLNVFYKYWNEDFRQSSEGEVKKVNLVWGIQGIDRTGLDGNDDVSFGTPVFVGKDTFDLQSPASQLEILETCQKGAALEVTLNGQVECFMIDFKSFCNTTNVTFPVAENQFIPTMQTFLDSNEKHRNSVNIKDGRVRFAYVIFNTTLPLVPKPEEMAAQYKAWSEFVDKRNKEVTHTKGMYATSWDFVWMDTTQILVSSSLLGCGVSLILAFVVLCFVSGNVIIALLATFSITCIVLCVIGFIPMIGMKLGVVSSICITVLVGLSVDFVVHLSIAFQESHRETRYEKTQDAFTELGVSILGGFLTTSSTTLSLFGCATLILKSFGHIILATIVSSFLFANVFFMATLMQFGPEGQDGDLRVMWRKMTGKCGRKK